MNDGTENGRWQLNVGLRLLIVGFAIAASGSAGALGAGQALTSPEASDSDFCIATELDTECNFNCGSQQTVFIHVIRLPFGAGLADCPGGADASCTIPIGEFQCDDNSNPFKTVGGMGTCRLFLPADFVHCSAS